MNAAKEYRQNCINTFAVPRYYETQRRECRAARADAIAREGGIEGLERRVANLRAHLAAHRVRGQGRRSQKAQLRRFEELLEEARRG